MRPTKNNVYSLDQLLKRRKSLKTCTNQNTNGQVINMMTYCSCCEKQTTKKNFSGGFYLCDDCVDLTPSEIYVKVVDNIENDLKSEIQSYIDWDAEDLDYLYYMVWCDDNDTPPLNR